MRAPAESLLARLPASQGRRSGQRSLLVWSCGDNRYGVVSYIVRSWRRFRFVLEFSKDLIRTDSCFDSWINFSASAIKRLVFEFSSRILHRNKADSSTCCDLGTTCVLLSNNRLASDANNQIAQETDARSGHGGEMCKGTLRV